MAPANLRCISSSSHPENGSVKQDNIIGQHFCWGDTEQRIVTNMMLSADVDLGILLIVLESTEPCFALHLAN